MCSNIEEFSENPLLSDIRLFASLMQEAIDEEPDSKDKETGKSYGLRLARAYGKQVSTCSAVLIRCKRIIEDEEYRMKIQKELNTYKP